MDSSNWQQGGVTTVVTPSAAPPPSFELLQPSNQEEEKKVNRGGGRKPRDKEEETLCPEEEERRKMRRERNKLAAARCRKRRVDQTESLQDEVNLWEGKKKALQEQVQQEESRPDGEPAGRGEPVGGQEEGLAGADPAAAGGEEPAGVHLGGAQVRVQQGLLRKCP